MKKRNLTMNKQIGIYGLALLVFMVICGSQDVLAVSAAADITSNLVSLNVNPVTQATAKVNQFTYITSSSGILQNVYTNWTEKAVFGSVVASTATGILPAAPVDSEVKITVTVKAPISTVTTGDLIVKCDMVMVTTNSALGVDVAATSGSGLIVQSSWMKYAYYPGPFSTTSSAISLVPNGMVPLNDPAGLPVDKKDLTSLCLLRYTSSNPLTLAGTTLTLLDFTTKFRMSAQITITAVLVDSVDNPYPQVMGVDVKTIFFNYVSATGAAKATYNPIWLDLIMAGDSFDYGP